ncbi:MAG: hypothetical protein ACI4I5_00995 [Acutalibacteraceae bacterium]
MRSYNLLMEHISVTPEMKRRFLQQAQSAEPYSRKPSHLGSRMLVAVAACVVLILVGLLAAKIGRSVQIEIKGVETAWGTVEYQNADALSKASGIPIEDLPDIPFAAAQTTYQDYRNNLVEIRYADMEQSLSYRVSEGSMDNSGVYTQYSRVQTVSVGGVPVTLKGDGTCIALALFEKDGYSYSLFSDAGMSEQVFLQLLEDAIAPRR